MDRCEGEDIPSKKSRKLCKYLDKWDGEFTFLKRSKLGDGHAFCKICHCDFSVSHGGRSDVRQHEKSAKHKRWLEAHEHDPAASTLVTTDTTEADQALNAEVKMAMLCAKNNISFTFCDDFKKCVAEMFPDSAIAQKYSAGKTTATQLMEAETLILSSELISSLQREKYRDVVQDQLKGEGNQNFEIPASEILTVRLGTDNIDLGLAGDQEEQMTREMDGGEDIPSKKSRKLCKYLDTWDSEFTFLQRSRLGKGHAFCKICNCDLSVSHGGRSDVRQHEKSAKHKRRLEAQKHTPSMSALVTRNTTEANPVINAEVKMAMLCAKNNISFTFCNDFNKCVAEMFPDSAIAQKYSAGKTKATQLVKGVIAAELDEELAKACRSQTFSLMCNELNNRKTGKEFIILIRLYDEATLQVATRFLEMPICHMGNAENLYEKLSEALRKRGIPWENLVAFNSDNASVMKGSHNSVISILKTSQPHVQDLGCICHLTQMAAGCAIRAAQIPVEDILVGIYTHFDKSAKKCGIYKEFVDFTDSDHLKLLRDCSIRWLSLLPCIQRVLTQWDALQAYFNSHEAAERSAKGHDLASHLRDPVMKIYFSFLTAALKPLSEFNIAFQSEGVQIHRLEEEMCRLLRRILGYLIPVWAMVGVPLREVEFGEGNQLADDELFIGADTKALMRSAELPASAEKKIFQSVRRFYEAALQKMFSSFPLDHPLLRDLKVLEPAARLDITPKTVERLVALFPQLSLSEDRLREELIDYQLTDSKQLPQEDKIDRFWGLLGKDARFRELPRLMKALLCVPHSNASSERVFSMVRKILTESRMSLDNSTVCALLSCKLNHSGPAHKYTPSPELLKHAKSATNLYNKSLMNTGDFMELARLTGRIRDQGEDQDVKDWKNFHDYKVKHVKIN